MECKSCLVQELTFEFRIIDKSNLQVVPKIIKYLERGHSLIKVKSNESIVLAIKENGVRDFLDFCKDHLDATHITFRVDRKEWLELSQIDRILDVHWIDEVIRNESVLCHFQPIVNVKEEIYAYESLARFQRTDGSLIFPQEIFSAARSRGRLYALDKLCRMSAVKHGATINKKIFINFIPTSIYSPEFCLQSTVQLAEQLGIDPSIFVFEVVETEKVEDIEHLKRILAFYKKRGFSYALDDVGEGYSTIEMLSELQPQYMKLDMRYVQGVSQDVTKQRIANIFLEKANNIQSIPLAEGVECREDFEWLKERGYQLFQGYYFGRPEPITRK